MAGAPGEQRVIKGEGIGPIARILQYPSEVEIGLRRAGIDREGFAGRQGGLDRPPPSRRQRAKARWATASPGAKEAARAASGQPRPDRP